MPYKDPTSLAAKASRKRQAQNYKKNHPDRLKRIQHNANLQRKFGINADDWEWMNLAQRGLCAICQKPEKYKWKGIVPSLGVDHNHETGKIRELLCMDCNRGIGCFDEDILRLQAAIEYLKKHSQD